MPGETVTLGRMEFVGEELVLTVNSAKRLAVARPWLEKLPGVVFKSVRTRRWDEAEKDRPLDERISPPKPVEMTPELNAAVQAMMDKHYKAWIDTPLPVLGGKTPRQACQTEAGRQQVTMLIRTMPDPMGRGSVRAPRQAMLRELGLTTEITSSPPVAPQTPPLPLPIQPVAAHPKVARNAPCPCGSGRKYKVLRPVEEGLSTAWRECGPWRSGHVQQMQVFRDTNRLGSAIAEPGSGEGASCETGFPDILSGRVAMMWMQMPGCNDANTE